MRHEADHPAPAELLAVYLGTIDSETRDPIEEHLSQCPECARAVLDFAAFPDLPPVEEDGADAEIGRRLDDQKRRLIESAREEMVEPREQMPSRAGAPVERLRKEAPSRSRTAPWIASPVVAWGVAAMFFVATVGLGVWRSELRQDGIGPAFVATVTSTRGIEDVLEIRLDGKGSLIRLTLLEPVRHFPEYRVTLKHEQTGAVVDSSSGFRLQEEGISLDVRVLHSIVSPGFYRFEVMGLGSEEEEEYVGLVRVNFISASEMQTQTE